MKQNKLYFNQLLFKYNKYKRKLSALQFRDRNVRKQAILTKRITALFQKLISLKEAIRLSTATAVTAMAVFATVTNQSATAQNFLPAQISPFGLDTLSGSSAPTFVDLDGDGDKDMLSGSTYGDFYYYENTGTSSAPSFGSSLLNPFSLTNIGSSNSMPTFVDIDNDGDMDLFVGSNMNSHDGSFYYYENTGDVSTPTFAAQTTNPFSLTNVPGYSYNGYYGTYTYATSSPTFVDFDNDGDMDLISGSYYSDFYYYENTGTASTPDFSTAPIQNPNGLTTVGYYSLSPAIGDLDNDGDMDLLAGTYGNYGELTYFQNTGSQSIPSFATSQTNPYNLDNVGTILGQNYGSANPTFVDLDNDGDLDVMAGHSYGAFVYFKNCTPTHDSLGISTCDSFYTSPSGNYTWTTAGVYYDTIQNIGGCDSTIIINLNFNILSASATQIGVNLTASPAGGFYNWINCTTNTSTGDTNQTFTATTNGDYAVVVTKNGCSDTSACFTVSTVGITENKISSYDIFPNPVSSELKITGISKISKIEVFDLTGKLIQEMNVQSNTVVLNMEQYQEGMYLVKLHATNGEVFTNRVIKK